MTVVQVMCYLDQTTFSMSHPKTSKTDISCCDIIGFKILGYCMYTPDQKRTGYTDNTKDKKERQLLKLKTVAMIMTAVQSNIGQNFPYLPRGLSRISSTLKR